ncbi:membrane cofactor protein isoform X2 [Numida meleagris]|uniref:membrane cofactor protein isoform X2 n=1 Tax=Numida meleagris TaxID=8996 RepID=UPI000B3DA52D|nr:membrane cofactor protein isoform X2 [Numida meleagris]
MSSFPVGTTVTYTCLPGYKRIPGMPAARTCGGDLTWSSVDPFCTARTCNHPGDIENGFVHVTDLTFGSSANFSCEIGYRLIGSSQISCVIKGKGVDWNEEPPICYKISCEPPPSIANGHYSEEQDYVYQTAVRYTCDDVPYGKDPFSLVGEASIFCTADKDLNGVWSGPPPQCKVVTCENPEVENGRKLFGSAARYSYRDSVTFVCDPGYDMSGEDVITCQGNSTWYPPKPSCIKSGSVPPDSSPVISHGRIIEGKKPAYSVGDSITIECYVGYTLHGADRIQYIGEGRWSPEVPTCKLSVYIIVIICVIMAILMFLAAFWVCKKFISQEGSYTVDESCKKTCILKSNVPAEMEELHK